MLMGGMSFSNSVKAAGIGWIARLRNISAHVPELAEVTAALVGGIVVPQKLPCHLEVQAHHVSLDEARINHQQAERIRLHKFNAGQHVVGREVSQGCVHRLREGRCRHDRLQRIGRLPGQV